jgi:hypothetical protein
MVGRAGKGEWIMNIARFCVRFIRPSVALAVMGLLVSGACASPNGSAAGKGQASAAVAPDSSGSAGPTTSPAGSDDDRSVFENGGGQRQVRVIVKSSGDGDGENKAWITNDDNSAIRADAAMRKAEMAMKTAELQTTLKQLQPEMYLFGSGETEKGAYLGITTSPVSAALRNQLSLQRGVGLTVDYVEPGSPAEKAGIKRYDILERFNDQLLISSGQFSVLIRLQKAGDTVALTLIRQAKPMTVQATLAEHDVPVESDDGNAAFSMPRDVRIRLNKLSGNGNGASGTVFVTPDDPAMIAPGSVKQSVLTYVDDQHRLTITQKDGQDYLVATDLKGKVIFKGSVQTREQRAAVPEPISTKLRKLREQAARAPVHGGEAIDVTPEPEAAPEAPATPASPATPAPPAKQDSIRQRGGASAGSIA